MPDYQYTTGASVRGNLNARDISVTLGSQHQELPPKNIRFKIERPKETFTGREAFLEELDRAVKGAKDIGNAPVLTQKPMTVVTAGEGIGKTEAVRRYIQLHEHEYDHIIWINATETSTSSPRLEFVRLAQELKIPTRFGSRPLRLKSFDLIWKEVFEKLLLNAHLVLLVFDNAEAFEGNRDLKLNGIQELIPKSLLPFCVEPTIILTSRIKN